MASAPLAARRTFDFGRALTFVKGDPRWIAKLAIGSLVSLSGLLLIGLPLLPGYYVRLIRRSAAGEAHALPEWNNWGELFIDGLKVMAMVAVHFVVVGLPLSAAIFAVTRVLPLEGETPGAPPPVLAVLALYAVLGAFLFPLAFYTPSAQIRYAMTGSLRESLNVRANLGFVRDNVANYVLSLVFMVANTLSQFGVFACCVGLLPATLWAYGCLCYALGQTIRLSEAQR